jgi:Cu+-exporting ATPase
MSADPTTHPVATVDLAVTGMTCAACAARIERRLNRSEGITASVNYATERARVSIDPTCSAIGGSTRSSTNASPP